MTIGGPKRALLVEGTEEFASADMPGIRVECGSKQRGRWLELAAGFGDLAESEQSVGVCRVGHERAMKCVLRCSKIPVPERGGADREPICRRLESCALHV